MSRCRSIARTASGLVGPNARENRPCFVDFECRFAGYGGDPLREERRGGAFAAGKCAGRDETVLELAIAITPEIAELQRKIKAWDSAHPSEQEHHENIHARYDELGGYQLEPKAKRILAGLSFREKDFNRPLREMSGGWVMRAHLARLLTQEPDLLMLDEPTNHLDLESLQWFQEYLRNYPGGIVMISHDRNFLNQLVTHILEIRHGKLIRYRGELRGVSGATGGGGGAVGVGLQEPAAPKSPT